jgi:hypothetical protein
MILGDLHDINRSIIVVMSQNRVQSGVMVLRRIRVSNNKAPGQPRSPTDTIPFQMVYREY